MNHEIMWAQPPPLWPSPAVKFIPERTGALQKPAMFRFATDTFMEDFLNVLATEPHRLGEYTVRPETWRGFTPMAPPKPRKPPSAVLQRLGLFRRPGQNGALALPRAGSASASPPDIPLKLYQPAHQRHYLVASSLVCRVPGLPDRAVQTGREERTGFLMRRLLPPLNNPQAPVTEWEEHAWVRDLRGHTWRKVSSSASERVMEGEEVLPMFGVNIEEEGRQRRRLFAGVIPVGKREAYLGAPKTNGQQQPGITSRTARKILLRKEVIEPWKSLVGQAQRAQASLTGPFTGGDEAPSTSQRRANLKVEREQLQTSSWLILLDFARYLATYLKPVWQAVLDPSRATTLASAQATVYALLDTTVLGASLSAAIQFRDDRREDSLRLYAPNAVPSTLREALARYGTPSGDLNTTLEAQLDTLDQPYNRFSSASRAAWPPFIFPLADPQHPSAAPIPQASSPGTLSADEIDLIDESIGTNHLLERLDKLAVWIVRALEAQSADAAPEPDVPTAAIAPADTLTGWFRIRCAYERPACEPLHDEVVSAPTEPFQLAGFFDPDAPARPIRIGLPIDTSPAGLRKFDKNTAFVISDVLCGQIQRIKGLTLGDLVRSVLPWPFHKDLPVSGDGACKTDNNLSLGMICSLSIPIITICALILLMIMVKLLDIIFRWIPYFILCFPIPRFSAKSQS